MPETQGLRSGSQARINDVGKFLCLTMNLKRREAMRPCAWTLPQRNPARGRAPPSLHEAAPAQPKGECGERKRKQMKAKLLLFAFIYFSESGLFKWLLAIQIKKSRFVSTRLPGCGRSGCSLLASARRTLVGQVPHCQAS
jgi:hypothetical protein